MGIAQAATTTTNRSRVSRKGALIGDALRERHSPNPHCTRDGSATEASANCAANTRGALEESAPVFIERCVPGTSKCVTRRSNPTPALFTGEVGSVDGIGRVGVGIGVAAGDGVDGQESAGGGVQDLTSRNTSHAMLWQAVSP